jgi:hypothetical protein
LQGRGHVLQEAAAVVGAFREILRLPGRPPVLATLSPLERLTSSRYSRLLECESVSAC